jgi:hypothetical protein
VKNYMKKQIMIDPSFNPAIAYNLAKRVYFKNFRFKFKIAEEIKEDLLQEAWVRLYELSGKKTTDDRFDDNYCKFWVAHNAMLAFIKTWEKQVRYKQIWKNVEDVIRCYPELTLHSNFTTC